MADAANLQLIGIQRRRRRSTRSCMKACILQPLTCQPPSLTSSSNRDDRVDGELMSLRFPHKSTKRYPTSMWVAALGSCSSADKEDEAAAAAALVVVIDFSNSTKQSTKKVAGS